MNEYNFEVNFKRGRIKSNLKELVQNDYNSTKLNFTFDKEGRILFKMLYPDRTQYVDEIKNNTLIFGPGILNQEGDYEIEISLYSEDGKLTDYATETFYVRGELVNTDEIVIPDDRIPVLDNLIKEVEQVNNIDIDIEDSVITIVKKDGTIKSENVKGEEGKQGPEGPPGPEGPQGEKGETAITVNVGKVETVDFDAPADVINIGTDKDLILDFFIPKGKDGYTPVKGKDYFDGEKGETYTITNDDYQEIANVVEKDIQPTLDGNLKSAKDYTDNAITKDFKDITYNENTATFIFTRHDNTTFTVDLPIEQTVKNGYYNENNKELVLVLVSGQEIKIPASGLIDDYDGLDSATIQCVVSSDNKITCNIISGSISKTLLTTELQQEINNKVNNDTFTTELGKKINTADVGEEQYTITYEDGSTKTIKAVVWK